MYEKTNGRRCRDASPTGGRRCIRGDGRARTAISGRSAPPATALHPAPHPCSLTCLAFLSGFAITDLADVQVVVASQGGTLPGLRRPENP